MIGSVHIDLSQRSRCGHGGVKVTERSGCPCLCLGPGDQTCGENDENIAHLEMVKYKEMFK